MQEPQQPSPFPQSQPIAPQPKKPYSAEGPSVFYYIAAISLVNSILFIFDFGFYGSLAITSIITYIALAIGEGAGTLMIFIINGVAFLINAIIAAIVAGFGYLSSKGHGWAYVVGMIAYTVDTLIMIWLSDWIEVLIHAYVLFLIWKGWSSLRWSSLRKIKAEINRAETISPSVID
jgi:hypothetical protein